MIAFELKMKTKRLNDSLRGSWQAKAADAKKQRTKARVACPPWDGGALLVVRLTRVSPGTLDDDALPAALKHVRDGVADRLKVDDASPLVRWEYAQAKGEAAVRVEVLRDPVRMLEVWVDAGLIRAPRAVSNYVPPRATPVDAAKEAEAFAPPAEMKGCHAGRDGECDWKQCPQEANGRANYQPRCPLATPEDDEC